MARFTRRGFLTALLAGPAASKAAITSLLHPTRMFDRQTGISIRFVRQYDVVADRLPRRLDVYFHPDAFSMVMAPLDLCQPGDTLFIPAGTYPVHPSLETEAPL